MARKNRQTTKSPNHQIHNYWDRTQWPLQSLYFLLPLIVAYELGTWLYGRTGGRLPGRLTTETLLQQFFDLFGVTGYYLPGLLVLVVLLCWHLLRRDPWTLEPPLYLLMAVESVLLAAPLVVFSIVLFREPIMNAALAATDAQGPNSIISWLLLSLGAGIYEELVFRLIAIAVFHMVLVDLLALPKLYGAVGAVVLSAAAFAIVHFTGAGGGQPFALGRFLFYFTAGVYLAAVYVLRGFGVVVAVHAVFDVIIVCLNTYQSNGT